MEEAELEELVGEAQDAVEESQTELAEVGREMEVLEGEHTKAKAAYKQGVREAAKDRKAGKEKKQKLDRQKLIESKEYRASKDQVLLRYAAALDVVVSASAELVPLQSAKVLRILIKSLADTSALVQESALYALAQVAMPGHVPSAVAASEMMSSTHQRVRTAAGLCLGEIALGLEEAVDVLLWLLDGQGAHGLPISSDHKRSALDALALMLRTRETALTRLRQKAVAALQNLQDGDAEVREAAKKLSGFIAREDAFGLEGFRCQVSPPPPLPSFPRCLPLSPPSLSSLRARMPLFPSAPQPASRMHHCAGTVRCPVNPCRALASDKLAGTTQVDILYQAPPFLASSLVSYSASATVDLRPPYQKDNKRGMEPHSDMFASRLPPTLNHADRKQVAWPSMSNRCV